MARNFYFGTDASIAAGSAVFSAGINADASAFGLTSAQALAYSQIDAALQSAMQAATTPQTRTPVAVAEKNQAVKAMQRSAKNLADIIRSTPRVTDAQLISLGLLERPRRTRRNVPQAAPMVQVISVVGRAVNIRVCDRESATGRSKPFGARGAEIYSFVGQQPPADRSAYRFERFATRTTTQVIFPGDVPSGATVWLSARWVSARAETGTASEPICTALQGGPVGAATAGGIRGSVGQAGVRVAA